MKQTNLKMIKDVSKLLFDAVEIKSDGMFSFLIQHPFANGNLIGVAKTAKGLKEYREALKTVLTVDYVVISESQKEYYLSLLDMSDNCSLVDITLPQGKEVFRNHIFKLIDNAKYLIDILVLINKAWYMTFLKYAEPYLSDDDLGSLLGQCWVTQEFPNRDNNANLKEIIKWFRRSPKKKLMNDTELESYLSLILEDNFSLTVYRGVSLSGSPKGLSWTTNYDTAKWFATRLSTENSRVYKMAITDPSSILAIFTGRNESEVIVDITKSNNWEEIKGDYYGK